MLTSIFVASYIFLLPNDYFQKLLPKVIVDYGRKDSEIFETNQEINHKRAVYLPGKVPSPSPLFNTSEALTKFRAPQHKRQRHTGESE